MDFKLELIPIPVTDVDRAKDFYERQAGFRVDHDLAFGDEFRVVQLTPPGSACSIAFGKGMPGGAPGSVQMLHLVVDDIHAARAELVGRGMEVAEVETMSAEGKPDVSYARFADPDGNTWTLQQISAS
ncbi:catechol 2,3-dioxygenase-like lactoylglutathione lyase family enzyme [Catenulispora sp. GP43]|uniref:VOC family protein n=1 Tax=Catenulispora sp. GP43 TaxID=3156263 RepID=UPI003511F07C